MVNELGDTPGSPSVRTRGWILVAVGIVLGLGLSEAIRWSWPGGGGANGLVGSSRALEIEVGASPSDSSGDLLADPRSREREAPSRVVAEGVVLSTSSSEQDAQLHARTLEDQRRALRLSTGFGTVDDVLSDPELNPRGISVGLPARRELENTLLRLNRRRSEAKDRLDAVEQALVMAKLDLGQFRPHLDSEPPHGPNGERRYFITQDGENAIVDLFPGEDTDVDQAQAELDLVVLQAREDLRRLIAQY